MLNELRSKLLQIVIASLASTLPVGAGDSLHLVPADFETYSISLTQLLQEEDNTKITIISGPHFGTVDLTVGWLHYRPAAEFWDSGFDRLRYRFHDTSRIYNVYFIADDGDLAVSENFEGTGTGMLLHDPDDLSSIVAGGMEGTWSLQIDILGRFQAYVRNSRPSDPRPDGKVGQGLDPDDDRNFVDLDRFVVIKGVDRWGLSSFSVTLDRSNGNRLCATAWQDDGSQVTAPCASIGSEPIKVILGWGRMPIALTRSEDAQPGFMYLLIDGRLASFTSRLDNENRFPSYWSFGVMEPSSANASGRLTIDSIEVWLRPVR